MPNHAQILEPIGLIRRESARPNAQLARFWDRLYGLPTVPLRPMGPGLAGGGDVLLGRREIVAELLVKKAGKIAQCPGTVPVRSAASRRNGPSAAISRS